MTSGRVFLIRHGETEWSRDGRHTGHTDVGLTENGIHQLEKSRETFVGAGKLIDPNNVFHIFCSPMGRAQHTVKLLRLDQNAHIDVKTTDDLREWNYGRYEGLTLKQVNDSRRKRGLDEDMTWNIWLDGCEGGENPTDVAIRCDKMILSIKAEMDRAAQYQHGPKDIVCVAHGHILTALALRWIGRSLREDSRLTLLPGGIVVLIYDPNDHEPAILLGSLPQ